MTPHQPQKRAVPLTPMQVANRLERALKDAETLEEMPFGPEERWLAGVVRWPFLTLSEREEIFEAREDHFDEHGKTPWPAGWEKTSAVRPNWDDMLETLSWTRHSSVRGHVWLLERVATGWSWRRLSDALRRSQGSVKKEHTQALGVLTRVANGVIDEKKWPREK